MTKKKKKNRYNGLNMTKEPMQKVNMKKEPAPKTAEDIKKEFSIVNTVLCFFILGNFVNISGYYLWEKVTGEDAQVLLVGVGIITLILTYFAFTKTKHTIAYGAFLGISFICSYIPYYLIVKYSGGTSFPVYVASGLIYNIIIGLTIILNKCKMKKNQIALVGILTSIAMFVIIIFSKDTYFISTILCYNPDNYVNIKWADIIKITSLFYIGTSIIQYVALFPIKASSKPYRILVISFVGILGLSVVFLLIILSEGNFDCGNGDCADCCDCDDALEIGDCGSDDNRKRQQGMTP